MSSERTIFNDLIDAIVKDDSIKKTRGVLQMKLIVRKKKAEKEGKMDDFFAELVSEFPQYLEKTNISVSSSSSPSSNSSPAFTTVGDVGYQEYIFQNGQPVVSAETLETGDCFYSSIFRAAREQGVLNAMQGCLRMTLGEDENLFIQEFRGKVSAEVLANRLPKEYDPATRRDVDVFDGLNEAQGVKGLYRAQLEAFPDWFQRTFLRFPTTRAEFLTNLAGQVKLVTKWVSEIEVKIVERLLNGCDILLHKVNRNIPRAERTFNRQPLLNLHNKGEYHWEYFSFQVPAGYEASTSFKRRVTREQAYLQKQKSVRNRLSNTAKANKGGARRVTRKKH